MSEKLFTSNEAAQMLDVSPSRIRQMVLRDEIEYRKLGRDLFFTEGAIKAAQGRKTKPGPVTKPKTEAKPKKGTQRA